MQALGSSVYDCSLLDHAVSPPLFKTLNGCSVSDHCNYLFIPSLKICFNVGLNVRKKSQEDSDHQQPKQGSTSSSGLARMIEIVCLTDTMSENIQGLLSLLEDQIHHQEGKVKIFLPEGKLNYLRAICEGIYGSAENCAKFVELIGVADHFKSYPLWSNHSNLELKTFPVRDENTESPEIGYSIVEKKKKLKSEFLEHVKRLKAHEKRVVIFWHLTPYT
ncbi:hypothetical protein C9374_011109 [Naegleria lovaniensis]|uniref:Uncharacterized protein n=1 Tax=Naegleria lovaniensis TaxID=51637 RepID=A0AA88KCP5_NAELO|nr:uncharacterized protein C9374_011109 [Naegleria lovaniensis]KAG2374030.1 hypothetical protein C9374_011109 [Naegleria lovaniensis]